MHDMSPMNNKMLTYHGNYNRYHSTQMKFDAKMLKTEKGALAEMNEITR